MSVIGEASYETSVSGYRIAYVNRFAPTVMLVESWDERPTLLAKLFLSSAVSKRTLNDIRFP
jgi:hypothetical protein